MVAKLHQEPTEVRNMTHDDLSLVSDIERRSYDFPWSHGVFRDCLLAGYNCIVLQRGESVVGYSILSIAAGEAHILNLCVDPDHRQLGYGEQLLDHLLRVATEAEVREVLLEVRPTNEHALALYAKKGFRQIASRTAYYQAMAGREDAAVLSLLLKSRD